ncbi:MAG: hypothetical protein VKK07_02265 [Merismopediaceae bacterium]|nr:hypothetical protein [Merismopediaceae bacterium]
MQLINLQTLYYIRRGSPKAPSDRRSGQFQQTAQAGTESLYPTINITPYRPIPLE